MSYVQYEKGMTRMYEGEGDGGGFWVLVIGWFSASWGLAIYDRIRERAPCPTAHKPHHGRFGEFLYLRLRLENTCPW